MYTWTILQVYKTSYVYLDNFSPFPVTLFHCSAWPRLKLNTKIGLHTTHQPPPTTKQSLRQQYLSSYWPDLDQTLNKGSWEHIQQITTVTTCPGNICPGDICPYKQHKYIQAEHFRLQSCLILSYLIKNFKGRAINH